MPLIIRKESYSRLPWRLVLVCGKDEKTVPDSGFATQRYAKIMHVKFLAIGDWDQFDTWTPAQHTAVQCILDTMPMRTHLHTLAQRGGGF